MPTYHIYKSHKQAKKFVVVDEQGHKVFFGATGYQDYTEHHDKERLERYNTRHQKSENWKDPASAGFWAKWILWNKPTILGSCRDTASKFKIKIRFHREKFKP